MNSNGNINNLNIRGWLILRQANWYTPSIAYTFMSTCSRPILAFGTLKFLLIIECFTLRWSHCEPVAYGWTGRQQLWTFCYICCKWNIYISGAVAICWHCQTPCHSSSRSQAVHVIWPWRLLWQTTLLLEDDWKVHCDMCSSTSLCLPYCFQI